MTCAERTQRLAPVLALALACACAGPAGEPPQPGAVRPSRGVRQRATAVVIEGERFVPVAVRRLSGSEAVEVDSRFSARLGDVALEQVVWRDEQHLEAVVPAGLAPGVYRLTVTSPREEDGSLDAAFQVHAEPFAGLEVGAALSRQALAPGEDAELQATLTNPGDAQLRELSATLVQEGEGRVELAPLPSASSAQLPAGSSTARGWSVRGLSPGEVRLFVEAQGVDAESGLEVRARTALAPLRVLAPAALEASLALEPALVNIGSEAALTLTLRNGGELPALDVQPAAPTLAGDAALVLVQGPDVAGFTLAPGESRTVRYALRALSAGGALVQVSVTARDASSGALVSATAAAQPLAVLVPAALGATWVLPPRVSVGQDFAVHLDVTNGGASAALALQPQLGAAGGVVQLGTAPAAQDVPGGQTRRYSWTARASAPGLPTFVASGAALDATSGASVPLAAAPSAALPVQSAAALDATLAAPASVGTGDTFEVVLTVRNAGQADAAEVLPTTLTASAPALVAPLTAPADASVSIAGGATALFRWSFRAQAAGSLTFGAAASGQDANSGAAVSAPAASSAPTRISLLRELVADPFGDGTAFSFVAAYGGRVLLGPSRSGTGAVSMNPDGTGAQSLAFTFPRDPGTGRSSSNKALPPYTSIGATGCQHDTTACGPDNEDGRGVFFSGAVGGTEYLGVAGGRLGGNWNYVYLTRDTGSPLRFSFVDLSNAPPGPATRGISSAHFFNGQLFMGLPDTGGSRPYFIQLRTFPAGPGGGLDAVRDTDALNLELDRAPGFGESGSPKNPAGTVGVDALQDFAGRLYLANNGAWLRTTVMDPRPYPVAPGDWAVITPSAALPATAAPASTYLAHPSVELEKSADLEPSDKAVPFFAVLQGRLYAARNTEAGPQLWVCNPARSLPAEHCDAPDWSLLVPNTTGTQTLSQFNDPANTHVTLLAASAARLYVGFNNLNGAVVYRSTGSAPTGAADFEGQGGCSAALGPTLCPGLGGNGLGSGAQRLYASAVLGSGGRDYAYLTAGRSGGAVRVYRISE